MEQLQSYFDRDIGELKPFSCQMQSSFSFEIIFLQNHETLFWVAIAKQAPDLQNSRYFECQKNFGESVLIS